MNVTFTVTNARINKGYQDKPAITINEQGTFAYFQASIQKYDTKAENKTKWINIPVRVLSKKIIERIQKLNLGEGSYINLSLELDNNEFTTNDGKKKTELAFNVIDFDIPKAQKTANNQQTGYPNQFQQNGAQQMPAQNNAYPMQNQYAGQMPPAQGNPQYPQNATQPQGASLPQGYSLIPQGNAPAQPTQPAQPAQPAQPTNAFVAPVGGGFTGFEAAGQAMGVPNDGSAFMGGFGEG